MPATPKSVARTSDATTEQQERVASEAARKQRQSDLLDQALLETFPASDAVSVVHVK